MKNTRVKNIKMPEPDLWKKVREMKDEKLAEMAKANSARAYRELVRRYRVKIFTYLVRLTGNREEAEDLLQNVLVKVYGNIQRFDTQKKFSSWIYRIAHNEAINFLKKRSQRQTISIEDIQSSRDKLEITDESKSPLDTWINKELKDEMHKALEKLPSKYKEVLILRYYLEKSYEEISEIINRPVNTVGTLLNRAKKRLLEVIKEEL